MSKTAIATLNKAAAIIATSGINVDLIGYLNEGRSRKTSDGKKLWRNADKLAALIVNSAANAFQCENSETIKNDGNWFTNMAQAIEAYTMSNLDDWSQAEWDDVKSFADMDQLARLADMVAANVAFEEREAAHAEALEVNALLTHAINCACCHADLDSVTHNAICNAVDYVRHCLLEANRYNNRFIVKMMAGVAKQAKKARDAAKIRHQEMLARCATATNEQILSEIPF